MTLAQLGARRIVVAAIVVAVVLRLGFGLLYWVGKPLTHDEEEYLALARSLAAGRGLVYGESHESGTAQQFGRAPGYPGFLAAIGAGSGDRDEALTRVKIAQALAGGGIVWLLAVIAGRAAGARAGVVAAALAAVYPPLVWFPAYVLSETLYSLIALASALVLDAAIHRPGAARSGGTGTLLGLAAGVLIGAAVLVRPAMLFFVPLALLWLLARRRNALAIAMLGASLAVIAPWTLRNFDVHGRFVLVASEGGVTFWTGNHPLARGEGDLAANPEIKVAELEFRRAHPGLSAEELEPLYYRDALSHIAHNPAWWVGLLARKAFYTVVPVGPSYALHSTRYRIASIVPYVLVLPFAVAGARRLWGLPGRPVPLFLLAASALLVCLVFFPQERFRVPVIDPVLIVCAAAALTPAAAWPSRTRP